MSISDQTREMQCHLCRGTAEPYAEGADRFLRCSRCGTICREKSGHLDRDEEKKRYLLHDNTEKNTGYLSYLKDFISSALIPYLDPGCRILDFGSGPEPVLSRILAASGYEVHSYDPFFQPDTHLLSHQYDAVVAVEVFEHIAGLGTTLSMLSEILRSRGILSVRTSLAPGTAAEFIRWWYIQDPTHITFLSSGSLEYIQGQFNTTLIHTKNQCEFTFRFP